MHRIELTTIKSRFATTASRITVRTAVELRLFRSHLHHRDAPPHRPRPPSLWDPWRAYERPVDSQRLGGAAHDGAHDRHTLLHRLKAMGVCPSLSRSSPPSVHGQINGAAVELLLLAVVEAEGGQAPRRRAWVGPWRPPSRRGHRGLLESEVRRGVTGPWRRR
jgi:hypothetical protein